MPPPRGVLYPRKITARSPPAPARSPFQRQPNTLPSQPNARQIPFAAAAAARRDYTVLPRRVETLKPGARRRAGLHHFVFWCLVMAEPPPKRARTAAPEPPSVTPADVAPEAQSDLAAFLARLRPRAGNPGKARSPGPLPQGAPPRRLRVLELAWAELPPADASRRSPRSSPSTPSRDIQTLVTRRLALAHVQVPPETLEEGITRSYLRRR